MQNTPTVVNEELTTPEEGTTPETVTEVIEETPGTAPKPGEKTDPNLLLDSLKKEREIRRLQEDKIAQLQEELSQLTPSAHSEEVYSDEGKALLKEISDLKKDLSGLKSESSKKDVIITNPILKDKWEDFEDFRNNPENKGMNMRTAAKAFLIENGLYDVPRKGLEKPTGGNKAPSSGMTSEDVKTLRETNFKKYQELLRKGQLPKIS